MADVVIALAILTFYLFCGWAVYKAVFTDTYYLIYSGEHKADVPEYLRAGNGWPQDECLELAVFLQSVGSDEARCEPVPTWRHWSNIGQNLWYQAELTVDWLMST